MTQRLIMVIAGTYWQIPILKKIRQMGHRSLVVNLYEDSPAFAYADYHEVGDILDKENCLAIAKKYAVDAVLSEECDIAMPTVAYIAEQLHLPALSRDMAELYTNKYRMRTFGEEHHLATPRYRMCHSVDEVRQFAAQLGKPVIIKPLDANSSRGVFVVDKDTPQLETLFDEALSYSKIEKAVLAEQYINGTEFTVDGIVLPDGHHSLAISEKKHYAHNRNIAYELFFSHYNERFDYDLLRATNDRFVNLSGLTAGCLTHAEYKYEDGVFYLIEIAARGGGNLISSHIVPIMSGVDNYRCLLNTCTGAADDTAVPTEGINRERCAVLYFFDTPGRGGVVSRIEGEDFLKSSDNVIAYKLNFAVGDRIEKAANDSKRIGFYVAYAESRDRLLSLMETINQKIKISYEEENH